MQFRSGWKWTVQEMWSVSFESLCRKFQLETKKWCQFDELGYRAKVWIKTYWRFIFWLQVILIVSLWYFRCVLFLVRIGWKIPKIFKIITWYQKSSKTSWWVRTSIALGHFHLIWFLKIIDKFSKK